MDKYMIASISCIKETEEGLLKRVKEQHLVPGETYSFAEEFVYSKIGIDKRTDLQLTNLKQEIVYKILFQTEDEIFDTWFRVVVSELDPDSEKGKRFNSVVYVNAEETKNVPSIIEASLLTSHDLRIEVIATSKILDVHFND